MTEPGGVSSGSDVISACNRRAEPAATTTEDNSIFQHVVGYSEHPPPCLICDIIGRVGTAPAPAAQRQSPPHPPQQSPTLKEKTSAPLYCRLFTTARLKSAFKFMDFLSGISSMMSSSFISAGVFVPSVSLQFVAGNGTEMCAPAVQPQRSPSPAAPCVGPQ